MYTGRNGQACLYVVPPGKIVFDEVQNDLRRFTRLRLRQLKDCTIWMRLSLLLKWLIAVVKIEKLISTHAISLAIRASKVANRHCRPPFWTWTFHLRLGPSFWRSGLQKYPVLVVHTNSPNPNGFKNVRFRCADSLVSCGRKAESYLKKFAVSKVYGA